MNNKVFTNPMSSSVFMQGSRAFANSTSSSGLTRRSRAFTNPLSSSGLTRRSRAFTLVELMIVIAIIGILAVIGIISYNGSQVKARDMKRKSDVQIIASALTFYHTESKTWKLPVSENIGKNATGNGYFNRTYSGGTSPQSIAKYLTDNGYLKGKVIDPSCKDQILNNCSENTLEAGKRYDYMVFTSTDGKSTSIYSVLERTDDTDIDLDALKAGNSSGIILNDGSCDGGADKACTEGMNYVVNIK